MSPEPFTHKPLVGSEGIRLLRFASREQEVDACSIALGHFPFVPTLRYEALSYVWGPERRSQSRSIWCNGALYTVTKNLYQALRWLKARNSRPSARDRRLSAQDYRYLWVDAICINQADPLEKQAQILLMPKIYEGAQKVIVWLGESSATSPSAFQQNGLFWPDDLIWYISHPYWTRMWTLLEIIYSKQRSILLGDTELDWDDFWRTILSSVPGLGKFVNESQLQEALQFYSLILSVNALKILLKDPTLAQLNPSLRPVAWFELQKLTTFAKGLHATDPRDMIYAWSGLVATLGIKLPSPDYTAPVETVFQVTKDILFEGCMKAKTKKIVDTKTFSQISKNQPDRISGKALCSVVQRSLTIRTKSGSTKLPPTGPGHAPNPVTSKSLDSGVSDDTSDLEILSSHNNGIFKGPEHKALQNLIDGSKRLLLMAVLDHLKLHQHGGSFVLCNGEGTSSQAGACGNQESKCSDRCTNQTKKQKVSPANSGIIWGPEGSRNEHQDEDDDELDGRQRKVPKKNGHDDLPDLYACPYFQRNSQNCQLHSACRGPGFPTIHRLKYSYHSHHWI
jgi:hypothetical protein